ncbi:MAG: sigma-70 family RNA polymerase sigma factor [Planctomycetota bacterium]|nr:sigma-70 family RNA polymerase sigma factor [Planctomycetota bacterium]
MTNEEATERFYELVWPLAATVLRTAQILTASTAEAEDLAQETMLKAFRAIESFRAGTDVKAWLMAILRNTRTDRIRAGVRSAANVSLDALPFEPAEHVGVPESGAAEWERPQELLNAFGDCDIIEGLQGLPEEIRWTLLLLDVEGLDQQDAARVLEVPVGTVKSRAHRGRAMLREALLPIARDRRLVE